MIKTMHLMSIFAIAGILIGSIAVSSSVFATYDKEGHSNQSGQSSSNANLYANSLSFDFGNMTGLDSCDAHAAPCVLMNPLGSDDLNEVFIADPALLNTRTLVTVNVNEQNNFPLGSTADGIADLFEYPECDIVTLAKFNDINGVFIECNKIDTGIIDVTYSFVDPRDDDSQDDYHGDDHSNDHNDHGDNYNNHGDDHSNYDSKKKN
ncbi:MAG: hypothetical protein K8Q89_07530 [Nitrosarchaeum sp.]|nr:hypothetical protein [Nitrosarchaeum sp.]